MLELADPSAYDPKWSKWNVSDLPIRVTAWRLVPKASAARQLEVIGSLLRNASEVIHAGDPDREGQLLVDEVLDHFKWSGPTQRLLITAADPETVRKALARMEPNAKFQGQRQSAECRQRADWLVGMNLSRAVTKQLSPGTLISIGRVQTPTLALVVRRHLAIEGFVAETFYTLRARFSLSGGRSIELRCEPDPRIKDERQAAAIGAALKGKQQPIAISVTDCSRGSPFPYHLVDFQKAAEKQFGWPVARALKALQEAYEAKVTSYPRVDCRYLPAEQMADAIPIAEKVAAALGVTDETRALMKPKKKVYDTSKVEVHHGIVPTGLIPGADLSSDGRKAWELVSLHFLRTLLPDETYEQTEVTAIVDTGQPEPHEALKFTAKAERLLNTGQNWRLVDIDARLPPASPRKKKDEDIQVIPAITDGELSEVTDCRRHAGKTTPPKAYTEVSLCEDMDSIAKYVEDERLKKILKETSGLGTPATQANIIETLKTRGYIAERGRNIVATPLGVEIIRAIPAELGDPGITAAWEDALANIAKGTYQPQAFMDRIDAMIIKRLQQTAELKERGVQIKGPPPSEKRSGGPAKKPPAKKAGQGDYKRVGTTAPNKPPSSKPPAGRSDPFL
jgi:DNA topoisomerase-3